MPIKQIHEDIIEVATSDVRSKMILLFSSLFYLAFSINLMINQWILQSSYGKIFVMGIALMGLLCALSGFLALAKPYQVKLVKFATGMLIFTSSTILSAYIILMLLLPDIGISAWFGVVNWAYITGLQIINVKYIALWSMWCKILKDLENDGNSGQQ